MQRSRRGFTLIELMVACAIVAILAAVAYPSYLSHVRKSARASAKAQMMDIANREQQFLLANRAYVDYSQLQTSGYSLPTDVSARYTPTVAVASTPPAFTVTFTPFGGQAADGALTLSSDGTRLPADKW
jgi:type IV pilus assembly protein PilE